MRNSLIVLIMMLLTAILTGRAYACTPISMTDEERFDKALAVFFARITELEPTRAKSLTGDADMAIIGRFELIETFKGNPPFDSRMRDEQTTCGLPLVPGTYYIFFTFGPEAVSSWAAGSRGFLSAADAEAIQIRAKLRGLARR
jgi:hypothetical protein